MPEARTLITGADGYLGRLLVEDLLATSDGPLLLWVRADDQVHARGKCGNALGPGVLADPRVRCTGGDLRSTDPFAGVRPGEVDRIVHLAAVTAFTVDADTASAVNVRGTARLLDFARRRQVDSVCLASTLYVSGLRGGVVEEDFISARPHFANEYERSKWAAEALAAAASDLPLSVVRIATVLADDASGVAGQHNAVHNTLRLLFYGLLSMMPGLAETPIHLTTAELAVAGLRAASGSGRGVYHAVGSGRLTLGQALDIAFETYARDERFARRQIRRPQFVDLDTFRLLGAAAGGVGLSALGQALGSVLPFAPQLYVDKGIAGERFDKLVPDRAALDPAALLAATCRELVGERSSHAIA